MDITFSDTSSETSGVSTNAGLSPGHVELYLVVETREGRNCRQTLAKTETAENRV